jgi:hypothetical protein
VEGTLLPFETVGATLELRLDRDPTAAPTFEVTLNGSDFFEVPAAGAGRDYSLLVPGLLVGENSITVRSRFGAGSFGPTASVRVRRDEAVSPVDLPSTWYLAEGASYPNLFTFILVANPFSTATEVEIELLVEQGENRTLRFPLTPFGRLTVELNDHVQNTGVSAIVRSTNGQGIAVERTMYERNEGRFTAAHGTVAVPRPERDWFFAEGSAQSDTANGVAFETYILLANPTNQAVTAVVDFFPEIGPVRTGTFVVEPRRRRTVVPAVAFPGLHPNSFATRVRTTGGTGVVAERAMWWRDPAWTRGNFVEGHASPGIPEPSTSWYFAEGNTSGFDEFILLANENNMPAAVTLRYLLESADPVTRTLMMPPQSRTTVNVVYGAEGLGSGFAHGTAITSTQPIVAERSMYYNDGEVRAQAAHNSVGSPRLASKWLLPEGNGYDGTRTELLLANPGGETASITVLFLFEGGAAPLTETVAIAPNRSLRLLASAKAGLENQAFSTLVRSTQPIVVERSMYIDAGAPISIEYAAATNSPGIPLGGESTAPAALPIPAPASSFRLAEPPPTPTPTPRATPTPAL